MIEKDSWLVDQLVTLCPAFAAYFEEQRGMWIAPGAKRPSDFGIFTIFADYLILEYSCLTEDQKVRIGEFIEEHVRFPSDPFPFTNDLLVGIFEAVEDTPIAREFAEHLGPASRARFRV